MKSYEEFIGFFKEIEPKLKMSRFDDYTMEDFGEVKLVVKSKSYSVILGNGYENVYGVIQFLEQAALVYSLKQLSQIQKRSLILS